MRDNEKMAVTIILAVVAAFAAFWVGLAVGRGVERGYVEGEAVREGAARWDADPQSGRAVIKWLKPGKTN